MSDYLRANTGVFSNARLVVSEDSKTLTLTLSGVEVATFPLGEFELVRRTPRSTEPPAWASDPNAFSGLT